MSRQAIDKTESAIDKVPMEILWDIFDDLIDLPILFATTYTGDDWTRDANVHMERDGYSSYDNCEHQRKIIGSVCRLWQLWAKLRSHRYVDIYHSYIAFEYDLDRLRKARRVWFVEGELSRKVQSAFPGGVNWEVLCGHPSTIAGFPPIPCPNVRRVRLSATRSSPFDTNIVLKILGQFSDITWIELDGPYFPKKHSEEDITHVIMPNLQVLYLTGVRFQLPLSLMALPSLQYLAIHLGDYVNGVSLNDIILPYAQTLRSIIIRLYSWFHIETVQFPQWNELPRLEEFVISHQWPIKFDLIPQSHPLRKLVARHASFDALSSLLDTENMRKLFLTGAYWTESRGLRLNRDHSNIQDVGALEEKAKTRGIRFAVAWGDEDEDQFMTRDEIEEVMRPK
jgi:hypothetical protein